MARSIRMPRCRAALVATALVVVLAPPPPVNASTIWVGVSAPQYESPGGIVPTIVTVHGVPSGYRARIKAKGTNGAVATCAGDVWRNPVRDTASRKCYLQLPTSTGSYNIRGTATLTRDGAPTVTRSGVGARAVLANGYRSGTPMSLDRIEAIERCFNRSDRVWLTFDDGGSAAQVSSILSTLRDRNVRARFFFTGNWAAQHPKLHRRIRREGHARGNHTYSHAPLSKLSRAQAASEIRRGVTGTGSPRLLRPPFAAGALTTRLRRVAAENGHQLCRWTVDTYDWDGATPEQMVERIRYGDYRTPPLRPGGNVLMHGGAPHTASGLRRIIRAVRAQGLGLQPLR